jgi:hypothetical protein
MPDRYCCVVVLLYSNPTAGVMGKGQWLFHKWHAYVVRKNCEDAKKEPSYIPADTMMRQRFFNW